MFERLFPIRGAVLPCAVLASTLCACDEAWARDDARDSAVELRYTEYGIPHIQSNSLERVALGQGYAQARDHLCEIERGMLGLAGELSRHFGPDAPRSSLAAVANSLDSDVYFRQLNQSGVLERLLQQPPPLGPSVEVRELVRGYVAGFNRYLAEGPPASCSGEEWFRQMTELDVYRRAHAVTLLMGQGLFAGGIVSATPPLGSAVSKPVLVSAAPPPKLPGSNAIALGAEATAFGGGINVANPHLEWAGDMRWWQSQLTVPGQLDVSGATVMGLPLVIMGHTAGAAWSITTAEQTRHATAFELTLVDGDPTSYWVDGEIEAMERRDIVVEVKQPDGGLAPVTRPLWWTRYGPVMGHVELLPVPPWSAGEGDNSGRAYVLVDPNLENLRMLDTVLAFNRAQSTDGIEAAIYQHQGMPWWSVLAADGAGQALWSQVQVVANVPDEHAERCSTELGRAYFSASRIPMLDGSRSECTWRSSADAVQPKTMGPSAQALTRSKRYLENSNGSHWLPAPEARISGLARLLGEEESELGLRTRGLIEQLEVSLARAPATRQSVQDLVLSNRSYGAELGLPGTLELCGELDGLALSTSGEPVDVRAACEILASWEGHMDPESRGALLFSRYWTRVMEASRQLAQSPWRVPFDVADPLHTPHTLNTSAPFVERALADAVQELEDVGVSVAAPLGAYQYVSHEGRRLPIGGGTDDLAVINLLAADFTAEGFAQPFYGSGYLHVVALDGSPCPDAATLLTYSQSSDPSSPHFRDQTELFSRKEWVQDRFCEADILAAPQLERLVLEE